MNPPRPSMMDGPSPQRRSMFASPARSRSRSVVPGATTTAPSASPSAHPSTSCRGVNVMERG